MIENLKTVCFDNDLQIEAYQFTGVEQNFPNHFHDYYVIGLIEVGQRQLTVNQQNYQIGPQDLLTFNPLDKHACEQIDGGLLSYRCFNIKAEVFASVVKKIFDCEKLPQFEAPVQVQTPFASTYRKLHECIMSGGSILEKEELFLLLMQQILSSYANFDQSIASQSVRQEIEEVCDYLQDHYSERISLDTLADIAKLNKYSFLRTFTRWKGITPYRYLETLRINQAKVLLEKGMPVAEVAHRTGFSDQSHFTSYFNLLIGLTPKQYQDIFEENL